MITDKIKQVYEFRLNINPEFSFARFVDKSVWYVSFLISISVYNVESDHDFFDSKTFFIFFISLSSSDCGTHHTMINKLEYVDAEMFISETDFSYRSILLCTAFPPEFCWFESFADKLSENLLTFRDNLFFCVCHFLGDLIV